VAADRPERLRGAALMASDYEWLREFESGSTAAEIARKHRTTARHVERRLKAAREAEAAARYEADVPPWLAWITPLFPIAPFTPQSTCAHKGPIPAGSRLYCPVDGCHQSGFDGHPYLKRDPRTDPKPEPRPPAGAAPKTAAKTRRERRAARRGAA